ncbi:Txe/YoeB family addiction module toxin [Candidatus Peregrinibacteria bacterium]|nr:Txe/YoeB family addiction module toxin [Candidatus Peregrinibacteria bacterium]
MQIEFTDAAYEDYLFWKRRDPKKFERISALCQAIVQNPFDGIGKPEPLLFDLHGCWSRRIDKTHRLVYRVEKDTITVFACRHHY